MSDPGGKEREAQFERYLPADGPGPYTDGELWALRQARPWGGATPAALIEKGFDVARRYYTAPLAVQDSVMLADEEPLECGRCGGCFENCPECGGTGLAAREDTERPDAKPERLSTVEEFAITAFERLETIYTTMEGTAAMEAVRRISLDARKALREMANPPVRDTEQEHER